MSQISSFIIKRGGSTRLHCKISQNVIKKPFFINVFIKHFRGYKLTGLLHTILNYGFAQVKSFTVTRFLGNSLFS